MTNFLLFTIAILSWGTSWYAIKFQLGPVPSELSVAYRFLAGGLILLAFAKFKGHRKFSLKEHGLMLGQGLFLFCGNYILIYHSSHFLSSGVAAVVFSTLGLFNAINARIFLRQELSPVVLFAGILSIFGLVFVFWQDFIALDAGTQLIAGLALALGSAYLASLGNMIAFQTKKLDLPIVPLTGYAMFYGSLISLAFSSLRGQTLVFDTSTNYLLSIAFLVIFATVLAFISYLTLLRDVGPSKAAYVIYGYPAVALVVSAMFEGYKISAVNLIGFALVLTGNLMILKSKKVETAFSKLRLRPVHGPYAGYALKVSCKKSKAC